MKKTYIKPAIETLHISTQHVIAVSFYGNGETGMGDLNDEYANEVLSLEEELSFIVGQ